MSLQKQIEHSRRKKCPDESQLSNHSWSEGQQEVEKARDEVSKSFSQIENYQGTEQKQKRQALNILALNYQFSAMQEFPTFWYCDTTNVFGPIHSSPGRHTG